MVPWLLLCSLLLTTHLAHAESIDAGRMGDVAYIVPDGPPQGVVFLFSGSNGWTPDLDAAASAIAALDVAVAEVDLPRYLERLRASDDGCHYLISEIEDTSKRLQARLALGRYHAPILAGTGMGAALAYAALAQSPAATVDGAASDGFDVVLDTRVPLCPGAAATRVAGGFAYAPDGDLPGWWRLAVTKDRMAEAARYYDEASLDPDDIIEASDQSTVSDRLLSLLQEPVEAMKRNVSPISDLPVVEVEAEGTGPYFAIIYSGDGGWRDLDKQIGEDLADHGVPVVGVDSLRYFWKKKTPAGIAEDLALIIDYYRQKWQRDAVVLIGYSFGADILPFAYNRLPEERRQKVLMLSLLGLATAADFEVHVTGWLAAGPSDEAKPVAPEIRRIDPRKIQCFHGEDEEDSACLSPLLADAERIRTSGGHHFDGNYAALAQRILAGAERRRH